MKFKVKEDDAVKEVSGREAYPVIKRLLGYIAGQIFIPEPPHTTKVRRRAIAALRRNEPVSDGWDEDAQPNGRIIMRQVK